MLYYCLAHLVHPCITSTSELVHRIATISNDASSTLQVSQNQEGHIHRIVQSVTQPWSRIGESECRADISTGAPRDGPFCATRGGQCVSRKESWCLKKGPTN
ncbi:hypothetical protein B0T14DRAFT_145319 [Immersiella caudata]|uniref:Uncharacterized protein n=1 Tax=Immersiella caudata TaxID=314043 RepID=A0AA39X5R4_9PEZI|nr:hypothetical protein B0T14DRAFT_145319 [Immersiella caudata]